MRYHGPSHPFARRLPGGIRNYRDRTRLNGLIDEAVAVGRLAPHGHERAPGLDAARIVFHTGDVRVPALAENLCAIQQMLEGHC